MGLLLRAGQESGLMHIHQGERCKVCWDISLQYQRYNNICDVLHICGVFMLRTEGFFKISNKNFSCCTPVFALHSNLSRIIRYPDQNILVKTLGEKKHKASSSKVKKRELEGFLPPIPLPCSLA